MPENIPAPGAVDITLREHLERMITAQGKHLEDLIVQQARANSDRLEGFRNELALRDAAWGQLHSASQRAIDKAEGEMREKLAIMNEFRNALADQAARFVQREQFEDMRARMEGVVSRVELEATIRTRETRFIAAETRLTTIERNTSNYSEERMTQLERKTINYSEERMTQLEQWKNNMQGRLWGVPMVIGVVVFVITQLMRVLFPAAK